MHREDDHSAINGLFTQQDQIQQFVGQAVTKAQIRTAKAELSR